ncbi:MAG TPA: DUF6159 family protein [Acidimicrobiales bacterium]|nr:DUF6159 family protein [Acidimicrobiales bacterium]
MGRIERGFRLAGASWQVLRSDKALMVLPVVSVLAIVVFSAAVLSPALVNGVSHTSRPALYLLLALVYFVSTFVATFSNAAIVAAATDRLRGGPGSVSQGLRTAWTRVDKLLAWSALSASVGLVLRALEERGGIFGAIVGRLIGAAWSVVTFFVVPVMIYEPVGPIDAVKRSGSLFRQRWGEQLVGNGSISIAMIVVGIPVVVLCAVLGAVAPALAIVVAVLGFGTLLAAGAALSGIFNAALYRFAVSGEVSAPFFSQDFEQAFRPRRSRGGGLFGGGGLGGFGAPGGFSGKGFGHGDYEPPAI